MFQALSSQRSRIARISVLALLGGLLAFGAAPANAAIDISISCPGSIGDAGFTDLAGVPAAAGDAINCVTGYGISTGTTATTFDPFAGVERWQMALFMARQVTAHGLRAALPAGADQGFTDLAGVPAAAVTAINQITEFGIATGTSATTFDPFATVERWQMALFLARIIDVAIDDNSTTDDNANNMPSGADQGFKDLAGVPSAAVTAINQIAQLDVADGTAPSTFKPFESVDRWQMALFLARTLAADGIVETDPFLLSSSIADVDGSGTITAGDVLTLRFNEAMDLSTPDKPDLTVSDGAHTTVLDQQSKNVVWSWGPSGTILTGIITVDTAGPVGLPARISAASGGPFTDLFDLDGNPFDDTRGDLTLDIIAP